MEVMVTSCGVVTPSVVGNGHVLVPILSEERVSVVVESGLEEGTHSTATLFCDSQYITSTNFCEYI